MTTHDMTDDEINKTIAELLGLTRHDESYPYRPSPNGICKRIVWRDAKGEVRYTSDRFLPKFSESWDAIMPEVLKRAEASAEWARLFEGNIWAMGNDNRYRYRWFREPRELCLAFIETEKEVRK